MKAYEGSRGTAPVILNLSTRCRQVFIFMPRPLYPGEEKGAGLTSEPAWTFRRGVKLI